MSTHNTWPITTPKHTQEPWMATSSGLVVHDADVLAECRPETGDAARIVACVNALAGVEDPAAFVEAAKVLAAWAERRGTTIANGDDYGEIIDCLTHLRPGWGKERI